MGLQQVDCSVNQWHPIATPINSQTEAHQKGQTCAPGVLEPAWHLAFWEWGLSWELHHETDWLFFQ